MLENDVKVFEGEELVYYIDVYYDGKDVYGIESSDELIASVTSDKIEVEAACFDCVFFYIPAEFVSA